MSFYCRIVSGRLAAASHGETLPKYAARHVARCPKCAAEARAYERLHSLLRQEQTVEDLSPSWDALRRRLPLREGPQRPFRLMLKPIAAALGLVMAFALTYGLWPRPVQTVAQNDAPISHAAPVPKAAPPQSKAPKVTAPDKPDAPSAPRAIVRPSRSEKRMPRFYRPNELVAKKPKVDSSQPKAWEAPAPPPEVGVIDVATQDQDRDENSQFVIQTVAMEDGSYTAL